MRNSFIAHTYAYWTVSGSVGVSSYGLYDTCCTFVQYFGMNYSKKKEFYFLNHVHVNMN